MRQSTDKQAASQTTPLSRKQKVAQAMIISTAAFIVSFVALSTYYFFIPREFSGGVRTIYIGSLLIGTIWLVAFSFHSPREDCGRFFRLVLVTGIVLTILLSIFVNSKDAGPWIKFTQLLMGFPIIWVLGVYIQRRLKKG